MPIGLVVRAGPPDTFFVPRLIGQGAEDPAPRLARIRASVIHENYTTTPPSMSVKNRVTDCIRRLLLVVTPTGFEPVTLRLGNWTTQQLLASP